MTNEELQNMIFVEIVAPTEDGIELFSKDVRDEMHSRFKEKRDWDYIFNAAPESPSRDRWLELFKELDHE